MEKCDICSCNSLFPERLGSVNVCKVCFLKIRGPFWKCRDFESSKDLEKTKNKVLEQLKRLGYPSKILIGVTEYFDERVSFMQQCDACCEKVSNLKSIGKAKICQKCFTKIDVKEWKKTEYECNQDVEKNRKKILEIVENNSFPQIIIDDVNNHFDKKIQKGLFRLKNGHVGQILKVYETHCVLITNNNFDVEEISKQYGKIIQSNKSKTNNFLDNAGEVLVNGFLRGGVIKAGVSLATSAAVNATLNSAFPTKGEFKVVKGYKTIGYNEFDIVDYQPKNGDNEIGYIRFRNSLYHNKSSEDLVFFFNNNSYVVDIFKYIQDKIFKSKNLSNGVSVPDEILKYKKLLDIGAITQEEYDSKKNELLKL